MATASQCFAVLDDPLADMCTSASIQADQGEAVAIYAENKETALAIGVLKMSTEDIKTINKGHGVENLHFLTDGLWNHPMLG